MNSELTGECVLAATEVMAELDSLICRLKSCRSCRPRDGSYSSGRGASEEPDTFCGTPEFLTPEQPYNAAVDYTVLFEMLYGLPPSYSRSKAETFDNILHAPLMLRSVSFFRNCWKEMSPNDKVGAMTL
ncbi:Serine/threonine-protein kinase Sgk3 [Liparis tanakae]|uniref:Serine/threonine-protein kinase Sgk3 n=1 Tax=Liparis tanakae TaxID=230148 RepID=A0A4Z2ICL6_9TELE|nr:Serine/threonine-protein kinase Sgk3 [Liparis tanakae]